jgi:hypothetical protein
MDDNCYFLPNIAGMEPSLEQPDAAAIPFSTRQWPVLWQGIWTGLGLTLIACFFLPLYDVLNTHISGLKLLEAFNKDMKEFMRFIGEFTTFLMYAAPLLGVATGVWVSVQGILGLTRGRRFRWTAPAALAASAFFVFLTCAAKLDSPGGTMFFFGKLMPQPGWGFYLYMVLLLALVACGVVFAWLLRSQPNTAIDVQH